MPLSCSVHFYRSYNEQVSQLLGNHLCWITISAQNLFSHNWTLINSLLLLLDFNKEIENQTMHYNNHSRCISIGMNQIVHQTQGQMYKRSDCKVPFSKAHFHFLIMVIHLSLRKVPNWVARSNWNPLFTNIGVNAWDRGQC